MDGSGWAFRFQGNMGNCSAKPCISTGKACEHERQQLHEKPDPWVRYGQVYSIPASRLDVAAFGSLIPDLAAEPGEAS